MPDAVREVSVAIATGRAADVVLQARFRKACDEFSPDMVSQSAAEVVRQAALALVAQANHTPQSVLSILRQA